MENDAPQSEQLLDKLYEISGRDARTPEPSDYWLVATSLHHANAEIRERSIFVGGLKWRDPTILGYFGYVLLSNSEPEDQNQRLMVECLVSAALERSLDRGSVRKLLLGLLQCRDKQSYTAKAAFVGVRRLDGQITKQQFATLDYDDIEVDSIR